MKSIKHASVLAAVFCLSASTALALNIGGLKVPTPNTGNQPAATTASGNTQSRTGQSYANNSATGAEKSAHDMVKFLHEQFPQDKLHTNGSTISSGAPFAKVDSVLTAKYGPAIKRSGPKSATWKSTDAPDAYGLCGTLHISAISDTAINFDSSSSKCQ